MHLGGREGKYGQCENKEMVGGDGEKGKGKGSKEE